MTTEAKYSPGPWRYIGPNSLYPSRVMVAAAEDGIEIYNVPLTEETAANARLIAAAPELLEALRLVCFTIKDDARPMTNRQHDALVKAEAAIRKALGSQVEEG